MERWREGFHQKGKIHVPTKQLASSIILECLSPSCYACTSEQNIKKKLMIYVVWL